MIDIFWLCYLGILATAAIGILIKGGYNQILTPLVWKFVFVIALLWDAIISFKKFNEELTSPHG